MTEPRSHSGHPLRHARPVGPMRQTDMAHHRARNPEGSTRIDITPGNAGWDFLSFAVIELEPGDSHTSTRPDEETAIVPLRGSGTVRAGAHTFEISRTSVFEEMPHIVYVTPGDAIEVVADDGGFEFSIGSAQAEGRYPTRLVVPQEMKQELRGGGSAYRHVNHVLAPPIDAERLILYEVYVPRGTWSGWAPHRHDGRDGSPYLEEVYYFRVTPDNGFVMQRNWADDPDEASFDELFSARDGDAVLVTKGYHSSVACPSSHMMFLNYLAGELVDEERVTPPCFDQGHTWIQDDWDHDAWELPVVRKPE